MKCTLPGHNMHPAAAASADVNFARGWARSLEDREALATGLPVDQVRPILARRIGVAAGTLAGLRKNRVKGVASHIYRRLYLAVTRALEDELRRTEHELFKLRQAGIGPADDQMAAALADQRLIRRALGIPTPDEPA